MDGSITARARCRRLKCPCVIFCKDWTSPWTTAARRWRALRRLHLIPTLRRSPPRPLPPSITRGMRQRRRRLRSPPPTRRALWSIPSRKEKAMSETLYASFADATLAEKAAGALLDYGVKAEDLTLITRGSDADHHAAQHAAR